MVMFATIKTKIFGTIFIGTAILFSVMAVSFYLLTATLSDYKKIDATYKYPVNSINVIQLEFKSAIQAWQHTLIRGGDSSEREKYWQGFLEHTANINKNTQDLLKNPNLTPHTLNKVREFSNLFNDTEKNYHQGYQHFIENGFNIKATDSSVKSIDKAAAKVLSHLNEHLNRDFHEKTNALNSYTSNILWQILASLASICLLLLFILYFLLNKKVIYPITALINNVQNLAESNFHFTCAYNSNDEIGNLARDIMKLKEKMTNSISQVSMVGYQVDNSFEQLQQLSVVISDGARAQFDCVSSMQNSMSDLAGVSTTLTDSVEHSINANTQVKQLTETCLVVFQENEAEMKLLVDEVNIATQRTLELQQETSSISDILGIINAVADQTNLLSLNAAIEAARAGEAGRGFAVVADEVRSLAGKTSESTEMINKVITSLTNASEKAVKSMESGQKLTKANADKCETLVTHLQQIFSQLSEMDNASSSVEQAAIKQQQISTLLNSVLEQVAGFSDDYLKIADDTTVSNAIGSAANELKKLSNGLVKNTPDDSDELF